MLIFLRNKKNETITEMTVYIDYENNCVDVSTSIDTVKYSDLLLTVPENLRAKVIERIATFYEFRGWMWGVHFASKKNVPEEYDTICLIVRSMAELIAGELGLTVVED